MANLRAKQIDIYARLGDGSQGAGGFHPDLQILAFPQNLLSFFYWRVDVPPFNDVRVRQAVSLALDRDELITALYEGKGLSTIPARRPAVLVA